MRDAVEFAQRTSGRGRGKVVLVYPAERMNTITANALLKTLEEPPGDVRFVLASEAAHQLLPTIRSRCLGHTHAPGRRRTRPSAGWPAQGVPAADAPALLRAAGGRPEDALRAARRPGRDAKAWSLLPKAMARGDVSALADWTPGPGRRRAAEALPRPAGRARRRRSRASSPPPTCRRRRSLPALARGGATSPVQHAPSEHPFNAGLMLEALVAQARTALNSAS